MALILSENAKNKIPIKIFGFRPYDEAVVKELTVDIYPDPDNEDIQLTLAPVFSGMQREYASQTDIHPEAEPQANIKTDRTIKLPATALSRLGWEFDLTRWSRADYQKLKWTEDGNRVIQSPHPIPFEILYQLDLWTKYRSTMNQLVHRIMVKFVNRELWLSINIGEPWGIKKVPLKLSFGGPQELSGLEQDELDDRTFRMAITMNLDAWLFPDASSIPTIRRVIFDGDAPTTIIATLPKD